MADTWRLNSVSKDSNGTVIANVTYTVAGTDYPDQMVPVDTTTLQFARQSIIDFGASLRTQQTKWTIPPAVMALINQPQILP